MVRERLNPLRPTSESRTFLYFHCATGFATHRLAGMLDSLVRVQDGSVKTILSTSSSSMWLLAELYRILPAHKFLVYQDVPAQTTRYPAEALDSTFLGSINDIFQSLNRASPYLPPEFLSKIKTHVDPLDKKVHHKEHGPTQRAHPKGILDYI